MSSSNENGKSFTRERLIEGWLDKANEKGYQPVFCQTLAAKGHTILHSTRHSGMEFGKDVVSRDEKGQICAFQLKGNPGGRLGIAQWNDILPQVNALMIQPVEPPLVTEAQRGRPYLVTKGEVDEEVHAAVRGLNQVAETEGRQKLEIVSRGILLGDYLNPIVDSIWPPNTDIDAIILSSWTLDGEDIIFRSSIFMTLHA